MSRVVHIVFVRPTKKGNRSFLLAGGNRSLPAHLFPCEMADNIPEASSIQRVVSTLFRQTSICHVNGMSYKGVPVICVLVQKGTRTKPDVLAHWIPSRDVSLERVLAGQIEGHIPRLMRQFQRTFESLC